jgi:Ni,Fe-hydrogenase I cytochrome b subunit
MTREARLLSGIILITVPTIQYGGYFLLTSLTDKSSGYTENPLRQNFFRAGHAHAGVIVILSLVCSKHPSRRRVRKSTNVYEDLS